MIAFSQVCTTSSNNGSNTTHSYTANGLASVTAVTKGIAFVLFDSTSINTDPTSVTWGGVSMTKLGTINQTTRANTQSLWYVLNPASGAVTVVDNYAANNSPNMVWGIWSGVKQAAPEASNTGSTTVANNLTVSVTTLTSSAWVLSFFTNDFGNGVAGTNTTSRLAGVTSIGDTNGAITTPSSQGQAWSLTSSTNWTGFSVSIASDRLSFKW